MEKTTGLEYRIHEVTSRIIELRSIEGLSTALMAAKLGMSEGRWTLRAWRP